MQYQPREGSVVRCDFRGMIEPEMIKKRDVVVLTKHKKNSKLVTVIPLSSTAPTPPQSYHYMLSKNPRPDGDPTIQIWAKCDMVYTVSLERLEMHYTRTRRTARQVHQILLSPDEFAAIRQCVAIGMGLADNKGVPVWDFESGSV